MMGVIAIMTGSPGSSTAPPTTGVHGSFFERVSWFGLFAVQRWVLFATLGVIVWLLVSLYRPQARNIRRGVNTVLALPKSITAKRPTRIAFMVLALIVVLILPKLVHESFWMYLIVEQIGVWILLALGLNVVVGFAGLLDLGFAAFYAIGAYTTAWFTGALPMPALFHHPIPTLWVIPIGVLAAMIFGVLLGTPTLRLRGDYLAIVTLGFALIIDDFVEIQTGVTGGGIGTSSVPQPSINV
jgi:branched-chain amino acid transport system permease protein